MARRFVGVLVGLVVILGLGGGVALAEGGFYLGIGGSHAFSEIDNDTLADLTGISDLEDLDINIDFGDTYGFNARLGWRPLNFFALELNFDYLPGFDAGNALTLFDLPIAVDTSLDIMTLMLDAKLIPLRLGPVEFSIFGGLGGMKADLDLNASSPLRGERVAASTSDTLLCGELGIGVGVALGQHINVGVEGSYVGGFGDVGDYNYGIGYFLITGGIDFYFQ